VRDKWVELLAEAITRDGTGGEITRSRDRARMSKAGCATSGMNAKEYANIMGHTPTPGPGCWQSDLPSTVWYAVPCSKPDYTNVPTVSGSNDSSAGSGSTKTGWAQGDFSSVSGITSEGDTGFANPTTNKYYSLQINTNDFTCTVTGGYSNTCWEQFIFLNIPTGGTIEVVWYLPGYYASHGPCPSPFSRGLSPAQNDCIDIITGGAITHTNDPTTQLDKLTLLGKSNFQSSGNDVAQLCDGLGCYAATTTGSALGLSNNWTKTQFNVLGYGGDSTAQFNSGTSLTAEIFAQDGLGNAITPSCTTMTIGSTVTAESNNLNLVGTPSCVHSDPPLAHNSETESRP
jgi:hypothetical protein